VKLPKTYTRIELAGVYAGIWLDVRENVPMSVFDDFSSGRFAVILETLASICQRTNATDDEDQEIDVTTVAGWKKMPIDLVKAVPDLLVSVYAPPKPTSPPSATSSSSTSPEPSLASTPS